MSSKSTRHRENRAAEAHLLEASALEQRALQIARSEGRYAITASDRARASEELLAPNEIVSVPEMGSKLGGCEPASWSQPPGSMGRQAETVRPEDDGNPIRDLVENGMRGPCRSRHAEM
jgi:hypothetical protein